MAVEDRLADIEQQVSELVGIIHTVVIELTECKRHRMMQYKQETINVNTIKVLEEQLKKLNELKK